MDILRSFELFDANIKIDIQGTFEEPLFKASDIGKVLQLTKIYSSIAKFDINDKVILTIPSAGGTQKTIFLTEKGLYKVVGRSRKPIANKFQDWIATVIKEIRINNIFKLNLEKEIDRKLIENKEKINMHNFILKTYHNQNIVYVCKLKDTDIPNMYIIKIGSTQNIKERIANIKNNYNNSEVILLYAIQSNNHTKLERMIHKNETIKFNKYTEQNIKCNNKLSNETYLVNNEIYNIFITTIDTLKEQSFISTQNLNDLILLEKLKNKNIQYNILLEEQKILVEEQKEKCKILDFKKKEVEIELFKLNNNIKLNKKEDNNSNNNNNDNNNDNEDNNSDNEDNTIKLNYITKRNNGITIPKVYKYDPLNLLEPLDIYDSPAEVERSVKNISVARLKNAVKNNIIYKDYRWQYVLRTQLEPDKMEDTVASKHMSSEIKYIAMIDIKKVKILAVYPSQKEAIQARNMHCNGFSRAIKNGTISSGHYWNFFDKCDENLKKDYLKYNKLPEEFKSSRGIKIQQINPNTKQIIQIHTSKRDIVKNFQISNAKIDLLINDKTEPIYRGFIWKKEIEI